MAAARMEEMPSPGTAEMPGAAVSMPEWAVGMAARMRKAPVIRAAAAAGPPVGRVPSFRSPSSWGRGSTSPAPLIARRPPSPASRRPVRWKTRPRPLASRLGTVSASFAPLDPPGGMTWGSSVGALLLTTTLGATAVAPASGGNALTLPSQRHLVRVPGEGGRPDTLLVAIQQGGREGRGLGLYRSEDGGAHWSYLAPIQDDASHADTADLLVSGRDVALVYGWEAPSFSGSTRHDIWFEWWRYQPTTGTWRPEPAVRVFDETRSDRGFARPMLARDSRGRLWVQSFRNLAGGGSDVHAAVSEDGGASFIQLPVLGDTPARGGGVLFATGGRVIMLYDGHDAGTPARWRWRDDTWPLDQWCPRGVCLHRRHLPRGGALGGRGRGRRSTPGLQGRGRAPLVPALRRDRVRCAHLDREHARLGPPAGGHADGEWRGGGLLQPRPQHRVPLRTPRTGASRRGLGSRRPDRVPDGVQGLPGCARVPPRQRGAGALPLGRRAQCIRLGPGGAREPPVDADRAGPGRGNSGRGNSRRGNSGCGNSRRRNSRRGNSRRGNSRRGNSRCGRARCGWIAGRGAFAGGRGAALQ